MSPPPDIDALGPAELKALVLKLLEEVAEQRRTIAALRDEIARLKGGPGRPQLKPSGMDQATEPPRGQGREGQRRRGGTRAKLVIDEERRLAAEAPPGSRFKGYSGFVVQDLVIRRQVTLLRGFGILISKRQVVRLLIAGQQRFLDEARSVLRVGLATADWITVDDTGARHQARNGFCTQIGNARFTWFGTTGCKSRLNFLELLRAGHGDYIINAEALAYMHGRALAGPLIARLAEQGDRRFADRAAWQAHLDRLGFAALTVHPDPVLIATEGALWGSIKAHGLLNGTVIVSDDAGQFNVGQHGLCWIHAERLVHKLDTFSEAQRTAQQKVRALIWRFYRDLKAYRLNPTAARKASLRARFERIFTRKTGFVTLDRLLARLHANKSELLKVLERPEIPLHTNGSENDIRCQVTKRKISGGTRSEAGRDCRDAFLGLNKTCAKLGISFWNYLGARLAVPGAPTLPALPELVGATALQPP